MAHMPIGASWATASCTAESVVNIQLARVNTTPTAAARTTPSAAPLLQQVMVQRQGTSLHVPTFGFAGSLACAPVPCSCCLHGRRPPPPHAPQQQARPVRGTCGVRPVPRQEALGSKAEGLREVREEPEGLQWRAGGLGT